MYYFGGTDDVWLGLWGIIRVYDKYQNCLKPLCKGKDMILHFRHVRANRFDMELKDGASCPGDYLYRSGSFGWDVEYGMWGISA